MQYVDERSKVMGRHAELEALRNRNELTKKKAAFNADSPMSTSTLASFFLQQKQMKDDVRQSRLGAMSSLNQFRLKECDGMTPRSKNKNKRPTFGMPVSAYSTTMADVDDFFRKQKQFDVEWRQNKEAAFRKLHTYRQQHIHKENSSDQMEEKPSSPQEDSGSNGNNSGAMDDAYDCGDTNDNDTIIYNSLLMVHAELNHFFMAISGGETGNDVDLQSQDDVVVDETNLQESINGEESNVGALGESDDNEGIVDLSDTFRAVDIDPITAVDEVNDSTPAPGDLHFDEDVDIPLTSEEETTVTDAGEVTAEVVKMEDAMTNSRITVGTLGLDQVLDPFTGTRPSFEEAQKEFSQQQIESPTKACPLTEPSDDYMLAEGFNDQQVQNIVVDNLPSVTGPPPAQKSDSTVSSMGSSLEETGGPLSPGQSSCSSLSTFWKDDAPPQSDSGNEFYSALLTCNSEQYIPQLHSNRAACERCMTLASEDEREKFHREGRHVRIMIVRGGCRRSCSAFPRGKDDPPVRLCRKCYFDTHRPRRPMMDGRELRKSVASP